MKIYCTKLVVNKRELLTMHGAVLFAANHPNSFLDGIVLTTIFDNDVFSLARGDAFKNPKFSQLLRKLKLLPVYRTSEGVENLGQNYTTFRECISIFSEGKSVLIFSEGLCENEWHLRPLKKGSARLAIESWRKGQPLTVIPTAFNYSSFGNFGKEIHLNFGDPLTREKVLSEESDGKQLLEFNRQLFNQLQELVYEIPPQHPELLDRYFPKGKSLTGLLLALPAFVGWLLHAPLFYSCRYFARKHFITTGHFDSVLNASLLLFFPIYVIVITVAGSLLIHWWSLLIPFIMYLTAWCCTQLKYKMERKTLSNSDTLK